MKSLIPIILILILGLVMRIYGLNDSLPFWSDSAADLLITEKIWNSIKVFDFKNLPLAGPTANTYLSSDINQGLGISHGIGYYYFLTIPALYSNFNPYGLALFIILLNVLAIYLLFVFLRQISEEKTALLGSFLLAISSYSIFFSRISWNVNSVVFFTVSSLLVFTKILQGNLGYWPLFSLCSSFLTQIHVLGYPFVLVTFLPLILLRKITLPKGKLAVFTIFLFLLPQFPSIVVFFNRNSSYSGVLIQYLISTVKDLNNLGSYIVFLIKYISSEFIFAKQLNKNFLNIPTIYWFFIPLLIIIFHLVINKKSKFPPLQVDNLYKTLFISWSFSSLAILFISKSHLEKGNNYILVFLLPLFIFLFAFLLRYAFRSILLTPLALLVLLIFLYSNFANIWTHYPTVSLQDHQQLAGFLSSIGPGYELDIPEIAIQESIYWVLYKYAVPLPQKVNGNASWVLPLTRQVINLHNNYPIAKRYAVIYAGYKPILSNCFPDGRIGALSLYDCNVN